MNPIKNFTIERAAEIYRLYIRSELTMKQFAYAQGFTIDECFHLIEVGGAAYRCGY